MLIKLGVHSQPCQTFLELFMKVANRWKLLIIYAKSSFLDVWQGSESFSEKKSVCILKYFFSILDNIFLLEQLCMVTFLTWRLSEDNFITGSSQNTALVTQKQKDDKLEIMENNPILQPLLSDYNKDQTLNFQQHAVTTGTSIQPLYGSQQSGNALIGMWMSYSTEFTETVV